MTPGARGVNSRPPNRRITSPTGGLCVPACFSVRCSRRHRVSGAPGNRETGNRQPAVERRMRVAQQLDGA